MPTPAHILAKPADVADTVITSGDPARTEQLAGMLKDSKLVNANRGFTTYTGYYSGRRITVATHGIGGPSTSIVFEELHMLGAKAIVRFGTAGALVKSLRVGDFIVPTGAAYAEGSLRAYIDDGVLPAVPDLGLTNAIIGRCRAERLKFKEGLVFSSDAFYAQERKHLIPWTKRGVIGVEMECATLFTLGLLRGFKSASLLMLSNSLVTKAESALATAERLKPFAEKGARALLDALTGSARPTP